jgi:hypothetical protein
MESRIALALFLLLSGGCAGLKPAAPEALPYGIDLSFLHPVDDPGPRVAQMAAALPQSVKDHTYVYFINGFDPLYLANLKGLCNYVKTLGFSHCYCGEMTQTAFFRALILKTHHADPAARIILVGYSTGANSARDLAAELKDKGLPVDLLAYVGGDTIKNVPASRPSNVGSVLNITGHGLALLGYDLVFKGCDIEGASNHRLDTRHMLLPSRAQTAELLVKRVVAVCQAPARGGPALASADSSLAPRSGIKTVAWRPRSSSR